MLNTLDFTSCLKGGFYQDMGKSPVSCRNNAVNVLTTKDTKSTKFALGGRRIGVYLRDLCALRGEKHSDALIP